jgi:hypothetical protein
VREEEQFQGWLIQWRGDRFGFYGCGVSVDYYTELGWELSSRCGLVAEYGTESPEVVRHSIAVGFRPSPTVLEILQEVAA